MAKRTLCRRKDQPQQSNGDDTRFMTRTRLRPGGPANSPSSMASAGYINQRRMFNGSTMVRFNGGVSGGSMMEMDDFGNCGSRTLAARGGSGGYFGGHSTFASVAAPATPLVKQRTSAGGSPRVQMYRTRLVFSGEGRPPHVQHRLQTNDLGPTAPPNGFSKAHEASV